MHAGVHCSDNSLEKHSVTPAPNKPVDPVVVLLEVVETCLSSVSSCVKGINKVNRVLTWSLDRPPPSHAAFRALQGFSLDVGTLLQGTDCIQMGRALVRSGKNVDY